METRTKTLVDTEVEGNWRVPVEFVVQAETEAEAIGIVKKALYERLGMFTGTESVRNMVQGMRR